MEFKLNSFIVTDARESIETLQSRILGKIWQDIKGQLAQIAGSLSVLGSPVGLARNIGNGVQDFFYEPYLGLVQSPEEFLIGVKNGTSSLMVGVVSGTLTSTVALIGTASSGISYLSGDREFIKQRLLSRQKIHASRHGALESLKDGSEQFISGITSGVSGIFLKPIEEAQKDGAMGFIRGVGFGVVGAAVKPVLGIADGISSLAHGISNELGDTSSIHQVRPPRTFSRSIHDSTILILCSLNLTSAEAQVFIKIKAQEKLLNDEYIFDYKVNKNSQIILSEKFIYWRVKENPLITLSWNEISHAVFMGEQIGLYLYNNDSPVLILCKNENRAIQLYSIFVQHSYLFGNPSMIISLDAATNRMSHPTIDTLILTSTSTSNVNTSQNSPTTTTTTIESSKIPFSTSIIESKLFTTADDIGPISEQTSNELLYIECLKNTSPNLPENISTVGLLNGYQFGSFKLIPSKYRFENLNETLLIQKAKSLILKINIKSLINNNNNNNNDHHGNSSNIVDNNTSVDNTNTHIMKIPSFNFSLNYEILKEIDEIIHWLIYQWDIYHAATTISRCSVVIILNCSLNSIQILRTELKNGRYITIFGSTSYEEDSRSILPSGFAIVFTCGIFPSFMDNGKILLKLTTSSFDSTISNLITETSCQQLNGYSVGFLEKYNTEWWSKYVIQVK